METAMTLTQYQPESADSEHSRPDEVALRRTLAEFAAERDAILSQYTRIVNEVSDAEKRFGLLLQENYTRVATIECGHKHYHYPDSNLSGAERTLAGIRRNLDAQCWQFCMKNLGFDVLMDTATKNKFWAQCQEEPLEFTSEHAYATFGHFAANSASIMRQGLVNVFSGLSSKYKSNAPFSIGKKMIIGYAFGSYNCKVPLIQDLYRACCLLIGKREPEAADQNPLNRLGRYSDRSADCEYFTVKGFKNGNAHIKFKSQAVVDKLNREIAAHFGPTLAKDK